MSRYIVHKQISIKAEPAAVWDALTNPEKTKKYFYHCEVHSDWQEGHEISFKGRMFLIIKIEMKGSIMKVIPGQLLQYMLKNGKDTDTDAGYSIVTDSLTYQNGQTILSISDDVGGGENAEKRYNRSLRGWDKILTGLKKVVEEDKD